MAGDPRRARGVTRLVIPTPDDETAARARDLARQVAAYWDDRLGPELLGFYLLGSLAHGGFSRRYSDIDIGLVAETGVDDAARDAMRAAAAELSPELAPRLSLFWTDRSFALGRFPPLDRVDYLDYAVALVERERVRPERPSLADIQTYLRAAPFETWAARAKGFAAYERLEADDHKPYLRAHLYPARFVYSWMTGRMASNEDAVALVAECRPDGLDVALVARALQCRRDAADPDSLFPDRDALPRQVAACARLIAGA